MHQLARLKEPCVVIEKNCSKMDTHLLTDQQKKQSWRFRGLIKNVWTSRTQTPLWHHLRGWNLLGMYFYGTFDKQLGNQIWVTADGKRPFVLQPGFWSWKQMFSKVLFFQSWKQLFSKVLFLNTQYPVMVNIIDLYRRSQHSVQHCAHWTGLLAYSIKYVSVNVCVETVLPEVIKSVCWQCPTIGSSKTLLLHGNTSAHKARVTVTFLNKQSIWVLARPILPAFIQDLVKLKAVSSELWDLQCFLIQSSQCLWVLVQMAETVCVKWREYFVGNWML